MYTCLEIQNPLMTVYLSLVRDQRGGRLTTCSPYIIEVKQWLHLKENPARVLFDALSVLLRLKLKPPIRVFHKKGTYTVSTFKGIERLLFCPGDSEGVFVDTFNFAASCFGGKAAEGVLLEGVGHAVCEVKDMTLDVRCGLVWGTVFEQNLVVPVGVQRGVHVLRGVVAFRHIARLLLRQFVLVHGDLMPSVAH